MMSLVERLASNARGHVRAWIDDLWLRPPSVCLQQQKKVALTFFPCDFSFPYSDVILIKQQQEINDFYFISRRPAQKLQIYMVHIEPDHRG